MSEEPVPLSFVHCILDISDISDSELSDTDDE